MKKVLFLILYLLAKSPAAMASSGRFSAHCSPAISINTVYSQREPVIQSKGSAPRIHFGAAYNFFLQEHCDLTTGLSFSFGHISLVRTADTADLDIDEQYLLKSIWLPIELKFYTSEVRIDTSVYFKVGIVPSIHLPSRPTSTLKAGQVPFVTIRPFGLLILLGIGAKYDFSLTNSLCVGLSYYWDAPGIMYKNDPKSGSVHCHNNFLCIDISILF